MSRAPLRILTLISPSNYPNFAADSIYTFNRIMFDALAVAQPDVEVFAAAPPDMPALHPSIRILPMRYGSNKFEARFDFPWRDLRAILDEVRPNVCLVNMPEHAGALSVLVKDDLRLPCEIVSYVHYIAAHVEQGPARVHIERGMNEQGNGRAILLRLLEGLLASDMIFTCSRFGAQMIREICGLMLGSIGDLPPIHTLPPPIDPAEIGNIEDMEAASKPLLVYNHRLYDEYGTQKIFRLLSEFASQARGEFEVLVTNPTAGRTAERRRLNGQVDQNLADLAKLEFVNVTHFGDRRGYFRALCGAWGGLAPFKPHALWSMSVMDLLSCGRPVLSYDMAAFREMGLPEHDLAASDDAFLSRLRWMLREPPSLKTRLSSMAIAGQFSGPKIAARFVDCINGSRTA